jgi:hypothetical protein
MMQIKVKGTTTPMKAAATSHPADAPISHAQKAEERQRNLHPGGALVARCPLKGGDACLEPHTRRVLSEIDIERSSGKERGAQSGDKFKRLKHRKHLLEA